ncbi:MAG: response regulator [Clostridium septicum]|uniref:response regulator n=1 Tax=Clostridium septicum TaxID=1504 RepID=UPI00258894A6|nr:response regulator [Clostridium septicum]MDU1314713.1 response regulator [Clostridium septicum]
MINVILVEDDPMVREINYKFLMKIDGFNVIGQVDSIELAKKKIRESDADIILLDVFLPDGRGVDLLRWIRQNNIDLDALLITADNSLNTVNEAFKFGAVDYLVKPFTFKRFKEAFEKYRDRHDKLIEKKTLNQESIDEYILNSGKRNTENKHNDCDGELAKGLNKNTYNEIWKYISSNITGKFTADELADNVGLARVTVRRYLEYMCKEEKLNLNFEYGKVGRPVHYYEAKR